MTLLTIFLGVCILGLIALAVYQHQLIHNLRKSLEFEKVKYQHMREYYIEKKKYLKNVIKRYEDIIKSARDLTITLIDNVKFSTELNHDQNKNAKGFIKYELVKLCKKNKGEFNTTKTLVSLFNQNGEVAMKINKKSTKQLSE